VSGGNSGTAPPSPLAIRLRAVSEALQQPATLASQIFGKRERRNGHAIVRCNPTTERASCSSHSKFLRLGCQQGVKNMKVLSVVVIVLCMLGFVAPASAFDVANAFHDSPH
jgi:hypothetical protein